MIEVKEIFRDSSLSLNKLANQLNMSPIDLSNFIKIQYRMNFSEYLNHYRIKKVKEFLTSPSAKKFSMNGLAEEAGFGSKSSFYSIFKKHVGLTPARYINQQNLKE